MGIFVFLSLGDGTMRTPLLALAETPNRSGHAGSVLLADDFSGDGLLDLITESGVLLGNGDGTFLSRPSDDPERREENARELTFAGADFDRDGVLDLVRGNDSPDYARNTISVFRGRANGAAWPATQYVTGWGPSAVVAADLDGDGRADIATLNRIANTISVLLNRDVDESSLTRAVSAPSGTAIVARGSIATLYANVPGAVTDQATGPEWPEKLGGISLEVRDSAGVSRRAPLEYVSQSQVNFLVPEDTAIGEGFLLMIHESESTQIGTLQVEHVAPAVVLVRSWSMTPLAYDIRVDAEGRKTTTPTFTCNASGDCEPVPVDPSPWGSMLVFLVTGFRNATVDSVKCAISSLSLEVEFAGPSPIRGMQEIRVRVPAENYDFWDLPERQHSPEY